MAAAVFLGVAAAASAGTFYGRLQGREGDPNFSVFERADGTMVVRRFEVKHLPVTCTIDGGRPIATEMRVIVRRPLRVDGRSGHFAGKQKTLTDELLDFPENASAVIASVKGDLDEGGRSAEGKIKVRTRGVQLEAEGPRVSECRTRGWIPWRASNPLLGD